MLFDRVAMRVVDLIKINFPNGVRDDFIDTNRIFNIYSAQYSDGYISKEFIAEIIRANGIENGGRFYFISDNAAKAVVIFVNEILKKYPLVYYSTLYEKHSDFFSQLNIFSTGVLQKILQSNDSHNFYYADFCAANRMARLDYAIIKIFSTVETSLSAEYIQRKLYYVPNEKIMAVLNTDRFLPTINGEYIPMSKLHFDRDEIYTAMNQIRHTITAKGYATSENYELSSNFALNPNISERNIRNLIYEKFFADQFTKRGNKFFGNETVNDVQRPATFKAGMREFMSQRQEISMNDLLNCLSLYGMTKKAISVALDVAYEQMIRVEKNLFVKDSLINFNIDAVDAALSLFVQDKIIPLRAVVSFTGFPNLRGYSWNLFLLESFVRKYSRRYSFIVAAANSSNIGAIYPKSMKFSKYLDVQAMALLQENFLLERVAVEDFLNESGYRANFRSDKVTENIIARAKELRGIF